MHWLRLRRPSRLGPARTPPLRIADCTLHLQNLTDLANQIGAEGIWLIRGAKNAKLLYQPADEGEPPPNLPGMQLFRGLTVDLADLAAEMGAGAKILADLTLNLDIADAGVLVLMRFPADGGEPGIESR